MPLPPGLARRSRLATSGDAQEFDFTIPADFGAPPDEPEATGRSDSNTSDGVLTRLRQSVGASPRAVRDTDRGPPQWRCEPRVQHHTRGPLTVFVEGPCQLCAMLQTCMTA